MTKLRLLVAGETSVSYHVHLKGLTTYGEATHAVELGRFLDAMRIAGHEVDHLASHVAGREFPTTAKALARYDVVILSDITSDTLLLHPDVTVRGQRRVDVLRLVAERVASGGGLLMVGGYMSFSGIEGKARYQATKLSSVLPVEMGPGDDRMEEVEGVTPGVLRPEHPIMDGIPAAWPHVFGYNRLRARPGADVLMDVGEGWPFLVVADHGQGRVAAFASDFAPHWASPEFLAWDSYDRFWSQLIAWLAAR